MSRSGISSPDELLSYMAFPKRRKRRSLTSYIL